MAALAGKLLRGRYRVVRLIGEGAMSEVYLAVHHRQPERCFALKALKPHLVAHADFGRRFRDEGTVLQRLDHPGIVKVHDCFEEAGAVCMVLDFIDGQSLAERIRARGAMPQAVALPMFKTVLAALDHAHRNGVLHRDLKPSNILIDKRDRPLLCDFGIAKQVGQRGYTAAGMTVGTPQYMSPEQIQAPQTIDHRSDLYSAGIVLYEMLTGRVPFGNEDTASDYAILQQHVQAPPPDPRLFVPDLAPGLVDVLAQALQKTPDRRLQGSAEFRAAIERVESGEHEPPSPADDGRGEPADTVASAAAEPTHGAPSGRVRPYVVYRHPSAGAVAIKAGVCWPALWLGPLWMLWHRFHGRALVWLAGEGLLVATMLAIGADGRDGSVAALLALLGVVAVAVWAMPALFAARWLGDELLLRGYREAGVRMAPSGDAALKA